MIPFSPDCHIRLVNLRTSNVLKPFSPVQQFYPFEVAMEPPDHPPEEQQQENPPPEEPQMPSVEEAERLPDPAVEENPDPAGSGPRECVGTNFQQKKSKQRGSSPARPVTTVSGRTVRKLFRPDPECLRHINEGRSLGPLRRYGR